MGTFSFVLKEVKNTLTMSVPIVASQLLYAVSAFIGIAMTAHLGEAALAATVLVSVMWSVLIVFSLGTLNAVSVLIAHQYGAKNDAAIGDIMGQSCLLALIIIVVAILLLLSSHLFLHWSKQPDQVLDIAYQYINALVLTVPGVVIFVTIEQFFLGIGRTKIVLWASALIIPVEIPLIYSFVFGKCGLPKMGVAGIGYGLAIVNSLAAALLLVYLYVAPDYARYRIFKWVRQLNWRYLKELFRIGLPISMMQVIEVSTFFIAAFWISQFGTTLLAAHQLVSQYQSFIITFVFAMSQAVTIRVGHAIGRNDLHAVKYAAYTGIALNFVLMLIIVSIFTFLPKLVFQIDINIHDENNAALIKQATSLLVIANVLSLCDNFRIISYGALRGLKDTRFPMYTALISFWLVGLGTGYIFAFILHFRAYGVWWGLTVGIAVGAIIMNLRLQYLLRHVNLSNVKAVPELH